MSSSTFLQGLMTFDKDTITEEMVELLDPYLLMPDYTLEGAKKVLICVEVVEVFSISFCQIHSGQFSFPVSSVLTDFFRFCKYCLFCRVAVM